MTGISIFHSYDDIISIENLLAAWKEFRRGKKRKKDVQLFEFRLLENLVELNAELVAGTYRHGPYVHFRISDPKPRDIHKATVRDRLVHHAIYRKLYPVFNKTFIADSYSCRLGKGTHRALNTFRGYAYRASKNHTRTLWVLKCDIRKFFASIDHSILLTILRRYITDKRTLLLLESIIESFHTTARGKGLPLGNLTSQLLVNIYMNEFDQWVKHTLKGHYYLRYADDFVVLSTDRQVLQKMFVRMDTFLQKILKLEMHPDKVSITTLASGVDFLGWVHFSDHRVLRTATKKRMFRILSEKAGDEQVVQSYLGLLGHGNAYTLSKRIINSRNSPEGVST